MPTEHLTRTICRPRSAAQDPEAAVIQSLLQACDAFGALPVERLALFEAAVVASNLRMDADCEDGLGVLAQNPTWGHAVARRDPYAAALVFLKEARRVRARPNAPRLACRLAAAVQHRGGTWRHALAHHRAAVAMQPIAQPAPPIAPAIAVGGDMMPAGAQI